MTDSRVALLIDSGLKEESDLHVAMAVTVHGQR
jgi:hypothetical protein